MRASGVMPRLAASSALSSTVAAAPSEMLDELAAVTVPSFLNAGFRVGILLMSDLPGCSSVANSTSPLRVLTLTATISSLKNAAMSRQKGAHPAKRSSLNFAWNGSRKRSPSDAGCAGFLELVAVDGGLRYYALSLSLGWPADSCASTTAYGIR